MIRTLTAFDGGPGKPLTDVGKFSSTVVPRDTPMGVTTLIVGGVMRFPVGESVFCAANDAAKARRSKVRFMADYLAVS